MKTSFLHRFLTRSHPITDHSPGSVRAPLAESFSRLRRRATSALLASAAALCALPAIAADVTSTWSTASSNWGVNANWTNVPALGGFPSNGNLGVLTYDGVLANGGTITLDQNITIQKFTLSSGIVTGSFNLTLNDNLAWSGGTMSGTGVTSVAGAASTISRAAQIFFCRMSGG